MQKIVFIPLLCAFLLSQLCANQNQKSTTTPKQTQKSPTNQSTNKPANKSTNQTTKQPAKQPAKQPPKQPPKQPAKTTASPKSPQKPAQKSTTKTPQKAPQKAKSSAKSTKSTKNTKPTKARSTPKSTPRTLISQKELQDIASKAKVINYGEPNAPHLARLKKAFEGKNELKILVFGDSHIAGDTLTHEWRKSIIKPDSVGFIYPVFPTYHQNLLVKTIAKDYEVRNSRIDAYDDYPFGGVVARAKKENASVKITLKFPPEHQDFLFKVIFKSPSNTLGAFVISDSSGQSIRIAPKEINKWEISQDFALRFPVEIKSLVPNATLGGYFIYQDSKHISDTSPSSKAQLNKLKKMRPNATQDTDEAQTTQQSSTQNALENTDEEAKSSTQSSQNIQQAQDINPATQKFSYANLTNLPKNTNNLIAHIGANGARSDIWLKWNQKALNDTLCAFKYDFIVLVYGSNDALVMPLDTRTFEANYSALIALLRKCNEGASILLVGPPKVITKPRKAKNYRIAPYFVAVRESVKKVAKKEGTLYFDMHEFIENSGGKDAWVSKGLSKKDVHLTPFGYSLVANGITYGLGNMLNLSDSAIAKISSDTNQENTESTQDTKTKQANQPNNQESNTPDISTAPQEIWQTKTE
ncbi:GDSL-type esterase/lipase family protein [Helicobacter sp. T3_23-1056]